MISAKKRILFNETTLRTLPFTKSFIEIKWLVDFRKDPNTFKCLAIAYVSPFFQESWMLFMYRQCLRTQVRRVWKSFQVY